MKQPVLHSAKLQLRPLSLADAELVQVLAGDERIADTTASIPHPYPEGAAVAWLQGVALQREQGTGLSYAICREDRLLGVISLLKIAQGTAELGYWVGVPHWGKGIASEAVACLLDYVQQARLLAQLKARVLARNRASCRVLERNGFEHTDTQCTRCGYRQQEEATHYYSLWLERQPCAD